jgi:hypothetical protein
VIYSQLKPKGAPHAPFLKQTEKGTEKEEAGD